MPSPLVMPGACSSTPPSGLRFSCKRRKAVSGSSRGWVDRTDGNCSLPASSSVGARVHRRRPEELLTCGSASSDENPQVIQQPRRPRGARRPFHRSRLKRRLSPSHTRLWGVTSSFRIRAQTEPVTRHDGSLQTPGAGTQVHSPKLSDTSHQPHARGPTET